MFSRLVSTIMKMCSCLCSEPVDNPYLANATGGDGSDIGAFEEQSSALVLQVENVAGQTHTKQATFWGC
jgi:hypothetical protein